MIFVPADVESTLKLIDQYVVIPVTDVAAIETGTGL